MSSERGTRARYLSFGYELFLISSSILDPPSHIFENN
jgi:hypothetical protein